MGTIKQTARPTKDHNASRKATRASRLPWILAAVTAVLAFGALYLTFDAGNDSAADTAQTGDVPYAVGSPGSGAVAPEFTLPSTSGETVSLSDYQGKTTLLYFHEGLGCQPCWDQIRDLEAAPDDLKAAGIDELVTVTSGPVDLIAQKMQDDNLDAIALADVDLSVSQEYEANEYGMMGNSRNGHSFILVGPDGEIQWRADYGGAPDYTMYVPVPKVLADLQAGRESA